MPVSVIDDPAQVIISSGGITGTDGKDGTDGIGFNGVRKTILDNPLCYLYKKNNLVNQLSGELSVSREVGGSYTDIYGGLQSADPDEPREEANGWLITSDETDTFNVYNNIPLFDNGFTCVINLGYYLGGAISQDIIAVPSTSGNVFTVGTNASDNFISTIKGSGLTDYTAITTISATVSTPTTLILVYDGSDLNFYIDGVLSGTVNVTPELTAPIDIDSVVTINGSFTLNTTGIRFYDIVFNSDEIEYLS